MQKVVALTLDKAKFNVTYAKTKAEAMSAISDEIPDLILASDQVADLDASSFPTEVEAWTSGQRVTVLLVTGQDITEQRHYAGVLRKPFSPQDLQKIVSANIQAPAARATHREQPSNEHTDLGERFHDTFRDETSLVEETFSTELEDEEPTMVNIPTQGRNRPDPQRPTPPPSKEEQSSDEMLWSPPSRASSESNTGSWNVSPQPNKNQTASTIMSSEDSMAFKATMERQVSDKLQHEDLQQAVSKVLDKILPPIVEQLVQQRLDQLLEEQEQWVDLK